MSFVSISFDCQQVGCVALGATVLWIKNGYSGQHIFGVAPLTDLFFPAGKCLRFRAIVEFVLFVVIGVIMSITLTQPGNAQQAVAAGLGWTGLLTTGKSRKPAGSAPATPKSKVASGTK